MESHNKIIEISDLTVSFDGSKALDSVSANVEKGDFIAITGPNGGGKSTLLKSMLKLLRPTSGSVKYYW
ncbi:MAG TPA: ATP-binding cassette domain-containing protein, partial [Candidatus Limisoma intestinavium]|nr:ATP-binding cassette domain-containing protein [Candidatus Limisoma intestinavium]